MDDLDIARPPTVAAARAVTPPRGGRGEHVLELPPEGHRVALGGFVGLLEADLHQVVAELVLDVLPGEQLLGPVRVLLGAEHRDVAGAQFVGEVPENYPARTLYDKAQEGHYNLISALHKAMRGSDPNTALYWFARMLDGGEDPLFLARRLVRFASEDIGIADPHALQQALAARDVYERLGSPQRELAIAQAVVYLATAPKSFAVYRGFSAAQRSARRTGSLMPPAHMLNAPTRLMKDLGYGKDYQYDPDTADGFSGADFPDGMDRETYYQPTLTGCEAQITERLRHWAALRARRQRG